MKPRQGARNNALKGIRVTSLPFFLAKRFVAGDTIETAVAAVRRLNAVGLTATLDFLGENVRSIEESRIVATAYMELLDAIRREDIRADIAVKLTALGLAVSEKQCVTNLTDIAERATKNPDPFVHIDMESSSFAQKTLDIFERMHDAHSNIGPVIQAYLKRSPADIERLIDMHARIRLCKGAYRESPVAAHRDMSMIRRAYLHMAQALLARGTYPGIATHDERLIQAVCSHARERGISPQRFEFQMLYGVRPERQRILAAEGYAVRVYVPFGTHWASYFSRRIAERPENLFFALRAAFTK
jgi:proline dehydrogenase